MRSNTGTTIEPAQPGDVPLPRRDRRRQLIYFLAAVAFVAFTAGELLSQAVRLPPTPLSSILITICAIAASAMLTVGLEIRLSRRHDQTDADLARIEHRLNSRERSTEYVEG